MKKYIGILIGLAVVALLVLQLAGNKKKIAKQTSSDVISDQTEVVSTYTVALQDVNREFSSNAAVQAVKELNYVSDITGRVTEVYVEKGAKVQKGQKLLKIDDELILADYTAAKAAYDAICKDEQRFSRSNEVGGISDQQLDQIRTQKQAAQSRLAMSQWKKDNAVVKAPIGGTINMRYVEPGSLIAPNAPLFEIVDDSQLKLTCMVAENRLPLIKVGQKVTASCNGKTFSGTVKSIGVKTDRGLNYPVEIKLDSNPELHIGMYLNVKFIQEGGAKGILVPRKAIVGSAMAANVFVAQDGKAEKREVKLGEMFGNNIEIIQGLQEGETLIVSGLMNIADGTTIRIAE